MARAAAHPRGRPRSSRPFAVAAGAVILTSPGDSTPGMPEPRPSIDPAARCRLGRRRSRAGATQAPTTQTAPTHDAAPTRTAPRTQGTWPRRQQYATTLTASPPPRHLPAGTILASRYRLEELIAESRPTVTWRAFDQVLSRSVLVHLLAPGDPAAADLLAAARRPRSPPTPASCGCWTRCTATTPSSAPTSSASTPTGQSLEVVLSHGPLSGLEAAWVVREVADALSGVHSLGLHHRRINPDTVIITPTGNVKIVGLLIEAALRGRPATVVHGADTPELVDVLDLGRLLYACLVSRWPGGPAYSLPDAPALGRRWMTPRQVRAGVSPALDNVCDQILGDPPRHQAPPITTANGVVNALTKVLGTADAAWTWSGGCKQPIPKVGGSRTPTRGQRLPGRRCWTSPPRPMFADHGPAVLPASVADAPRVSSCRWRRRPVRSRRYARPRAPRPPPKATGSRRQPQRWIGVLILLTVLLVGGSGRCRTGAEPADRRQRPALGRQPVSPAECRQPVRATDPQHRSRSPAPGTSTRRATHRGSRIPTRSASPTTEPQDPLAHGQLRGHPEARQPQARRRPRLRPRHGADRTLGRRSRSAAPAPTWSSGCRRATRPRSSTAPDEVGQPVAGSPVTGPPDRPPHCGRRSRPTRYVLVYLTSLPKDGKGYRGGNHEVEVPQLSGDQPPRHQ